MALAFIKKFFEELAAKKTLKRAEKAIAYMTEDRDRGFFSTNSKPSFYYDVRAEKQVYFIAYVPWLTAEEFEVMLSGFGDARPEWETKFYNPWLKVFFRDENDLIFLKIILGDWKIDCVHRVVDDWRKEEERAPDACT